MVTNSSMPIACLTKSSLLGTFANMVESFYFGFVPFLWSCASYCPVAALYLCDGFGSPSFLLLFGRILLDTFLVSKCNFSTGLKGSYAWGPGPFFSWAFDRSLTKRASYLANLPENMVFLSSTPNPVYRYWFKKLTWFDKGL